MLYLKYNYLNIRQTPTSDIRNTEQLFRPYWISSAVYTVVSITGDRTNNQKMLTPKVYPWVTGSYHT